MKFFKKKETTVQNLAFMGLMCAVNLILCLLSVYTSVFALFFIILLPLSSTLVEFFCKDRYYPIYLIGSVGLSLLVTFYNWDIAMFYLFPSIVTGYIFGFVLKNKLNPFWSIIVAALIQFGLTYASIPIINGILGIDIINNLRTMFKIESPTLDPIVPSCIFMIAFIQILLSYLVISNEVEKFGAAEHSNVQYRLEILIVGVAVPLSIVGIGFVSLDVSYILLIISFYFAAYLFIKDIITKQYIPLILKGSIILIGIILFLTLSGLMGGQVGLLLFAVIPFGINLISLVVYLLKYRQNSLK